jgi:hypothetical protein
MDPEIPEFIAQRDISSNPERQREVEDHGDQEGCPYPEIYSEDALDEVLFTDPAPILVQWY